ncbi:MAG: hypothetical protein KAF91_30015 [Nostoc sp. TH1S01]|nr:hypothetical protein [Nostoc sp. TH1S01]
MLILDRGVFWLLTPIFNYIGNLKKAMTSTTRYMSLRSPLSSDEQS